MPIHDWTKVPHGLFHHYHRAWLGHLCDALNDGTLPADHYALMEQRAVPYVPDVLGLAKRSTTTLPARTGAGKLLQAEPKVRYRAEASNADVYASRTDRIGVHDYMGKLVAAIELVSPGNKSGPEPLKQFIQKTLDFLYGGVNVFVIDLLLPTRRDPQGLHKCIWDNIEADDDYHLPRKRRLTLASYRVGPPKTAYVENVAVGERLPTMPLYLDEFQYVEVPLEETYVQCWNKQPAQYQEMILHPELCK